MTSHPQSRVATEEAWPGLPSHFPVHFHKAASLDTTHSGAGAGLATSERCRSLQGVGGERNDLSLPVDHDQDAVRGMHVDGTSVSTGGYGLRRTLATTSLLRFAQRSPARTCLLFASTVFVIGALLVIFSAGLLARNSARGGDVSRRFRIQDTASLRVARCGDDACSRMGALLKDSLDERAQPCDNFHAYVCGSWYRTHPGRTVAQVLTSAFLDNVTRRAKRVRIPFDPVSKKQTAVQKAARHLVACDDIVAASDDQSADVRKVLAEGGIMWPYRTAENSPSTDVLERMLYMSTVVKIPVLMGVTVERAINQRIVIKKPENVATVLGASRLRIKSMKFKEYEEFFRAVYDGFSQSDDLSYFVDRFNKVRRLESVLISFLNTSVLRQDSKRKDPWLTNVTNFQHITPTISKERWLEVLQRYLNISMDGDHAVMVLGRHYFRAVFDLYKELGVTDFAELYDWLCVQALISFTSGRAIAAERPGSHVLDSHREFCFANSDSIFHYALQYLYLSDIVTTEVREDVGKLMQVVGLSLGHIISRTKSPLLKINCTNDAVSRAADAYTRLFRRSSPEHFEEIYARYPEMKLSAMKNWIIMASATSTLNEEHNRLENFADAFRKDVSHTWNEPLEASYLDSPWYALSAPNTIKIAGLGSRLVGKLLSDILSEGICKDAILAEIEDAWHCMAAAIRDDHRNKSAIKKGVSYAMLSWAVLWEAYRGQTQYRGKATVLDNYQNLSELELFFIFGCLWSCGEGADVAEAYCNLPLRHDANFAKAFSCHRGSAMRPQIQCPRAFYAATKTSL